MSSKGQYFTASQKKLKNYHLKSFVNCRVSNGVIAKTARLTTEQAHLLVETIMSLTNSEDYAKDGHILLTLYKEGRITVQAKKKKPLPISPVPHQESEQ